jgi:hypothetical protein
MSYAEFMKEEIFKPLGLNETFIDNPYEIIPKDYLPKWILKRFKETESLTYIDEENVSENGMNFFGEKINYLRYYRINIDKPLYTIISLDRNRKVIFIDHPETE